MNKPRIHILLTLIFAIIFIFLIPIPLLLNGTVGFWGFISIMFGICGIVGTLVMQIIHSPHKQLEKVIMDRKTIEVQLNNKETALYNVLQIAKLGTWKLDLNSQILRLGDEHIVLMGYQAGQIPSDLSLMDYLKLYVHPEDFTTIINKFEHAVSNNDANFTDHFEYRLIHKDGFIRNMFVSVIGNQKHFNTIDGTSQDITDICNTKSALKTTLKQLSDFKFALDVSSLVTISDANGIIEYANEKFCLISQFRREELIGKNHRILSSGHHSKEFFREMWRTIQQGEVWRNDILNRAKDGTLHWFDTIIVPFMNDEGKPYQYVAMRTDSTHRKRSEEQITYMAYHDSLTGLPNRRLFMQRLEKSIAPAAINQKTAVILMDLDNFKFINDSLGHQIGDQLLQTFALRISEKIRSEDTIARLGGDEFILLLPDVDSQESVSQKCQMLIDTLQEPFHFNNKEYHLGVSIGVSLYPDHGEDAHEIVKNADIAMYKAKEKGKNSFYIYKSSLNEQVQKRLDFERLLRKALDNDEFVLHYQPKINLKTGTIYGIEALIRWQSPELGLVPPIKFIPFAEQNGLIEPICHWVLRTACLQNKEWQGKGFPPVVVSINISPRQFQQGNIVESVTSIIQQTRLNPKWVELEITESALMENPQECVNKLQALKDFGISLSIDDFGTGFSSLSYLKVFPVDYLKIDRCFINEIQANSKDRAITRSIITLARNLDIAVVAEGIEDEEQIKVLKEENCEYGQGYYWGYPQDAAAIAAHWASIQLHPAEN